MWSTVKRMLGTTTLSNAPRQEPAMQRPKILDHVIEEMPEVVILDEHQVRAKKEYICATCKGAIFEGQLYRRICWTDRNERHPKTGRKGGIMKMDRVHMRCW